jgi:hypothetical protein
MPTYNTCVTYHYFEANALYRENFLHFLTFGTQVDADIFCVISGDYTVKLPKLSNVTYLFTINHNYDYGAFAFALEKTIDTKAYAHYIFINTTVRGPYLPPYSDMQWIEAFIKPLGPSVGLVGTSINILPQENSKSMQFKEQYGGKPPYSHVQTMAYALSKKSLQFLIQKKFFDTTLQLNRSDLILRYEIYLSYLIIQNGWDIKCLLPEYNELDYKKSNSDTNVSSRNGEACYEEAYMGRSMHPYEVVFIKANRKIWPDYYLDMLSHSMWLSGRHKQNYCSSLTTSKFLGLKRKNELKLKIRSLFRSIKNLLKD